jgi:hypothetical protein
LTPYGTPWATPRPPGQGALAASGALYPPPGRHKPFGRRRHWADRSTITPGSARRLTERTLIMLPIAVLAIAGTGYGLIGLLVIILLVVLILRLV